MNIPELSEEDTRVKKALSFFQKKTLTFSDGAALAFAKQAITQAIESGIKGQLSLF